jgi:hypothetical protein
MSPASRKPRSRQRTQEREVSNTETSTEDLQTSTEKLQTVNEELEAGDTEPRQVDELGAASSDLRNLSAATESEARQLHGLGSTFDLKTPSTSNVTCSMSNGQFH